MIVALINIMIFELVAIVCAGEINMFDVCSISFAIINN